MFLLVKSSHSRPRSRNKSSKAPKQLKAELEAFCAELAAGKESDAEEKDENEPDEEEKDGVALGQKESEP